MRLLDRVISRYGDTFWEGEASGAAVLTTTYGNPDRESILPNIVSYAKNAYADNCVVFGAILARIKLFSQMEFKFQDESDGALSNLPPRAGFLKAPWPNGTSAELLARMMQDVDTAGNCYMVKGQDQLIRLRPDQVTIVSHQTTDRLTGNSYREVIGYSWDPTSPPNSPTPSSDAEFYDVDEVAHWSPIPDPQGMFKGMSWLTPVIREVTADTGMTDYKLRYLGNAATPNLILQYKQKLQGETIDALRERIQGRHGGVDNAFKTLILDQGADIHTVGNNFEQMAFSTVQAAGENRILIASGVPGIICGSKEGLAAATYSNYAQAMRSFGDFMHFFWGSACACLSKFVNVPAGSRLWYDTAQIPALRQSEKDAADAMQVQATAIGELVKFGYDPESCRDAVVSNDMSLLKHPGIPIQITSDVPVAKPAPIVLGAPGQPPPTVDPNPAAAAMGGPGPQQQQQNAPTPAMGGTANGKH